MLKRVITFALVIGCVATMSGAVADEHGRRLKGWELRPLARDHTSIGLSPGGYLYTVYRNVYGEMWGYAGRPHNPKQYYDEGWWTVVGDHFCAKFKEWHEGEKRCFVVYHLGGDQYAGEIVGYDGVRSTTNRTRWRLVPGNPEKLERSSRISAPRTEPCGSCGER